MQKNKLKLMSLILLTAPILSFSSLTLAADKASSDFVIRLFNNTSIKQPLNYTVVPENEGPINGTISSGDNHGQTITIASHSKDRQAATIVVADSTGHLIWEDKVSYYGSAHEFYNKIISLDPHYVLGTNTFPQLKAVSFDIRS